MELRDFSVGPDLWVGDSLSTTDYGNVPGLYATATGHKVTNRAIGGQGFVFAGGQIQAQYTNVATPRVHVAGGTNDFLNGASAAAVETAVLAFVDARRAEGKSVVLNDCPPCAGAAACNITVQGRINTYNAAIATACAARPDMICIGLNAILNNGSDGIKSACNSPDFIHLGAGTCQQEWADAVAAVAP